MSTSILLALAAIGVLGILCQWLAWWLRLPAILFLLICGILAGPVTGLLHPDRLFGDLLLPLVSLSVAVILFEGSLTLHLDEIRGLGTVVRNLVSAGALLTWAITAGATHYLVGFSLEVAILFGALVVVTGPTVIIPILRSVRPNASIASVLRWEGIVIDPLGALFAVLAFNFILSREAGNQVSSAVLIFGRVVLSGILIGILSALAAGFVLRRHLVPEYLRNVFVLTLVFAAFALSHLIAHESGLLAVTVMGMTLANMPDTDMEDILDFKESLSVLLISALFIVLGARIEPAQLWQVGWPAVLLLFVVMFVARPASVIVSTIGSHLNWRERFLIAWIGPRGIVCAAVAAAFALRLEQSGYEEGALLVPLAFLIIIGTVLVQSATAKPLARWLGVREPPPTGFLIIGAGNVARAIGKVLHEQKHKVLLTDSSWENTRLARLDGLDVYYGNPISEHADRSLDLVGIGRLLALSGRSNLDALACLRFRPEFGTRNVYELQSTREQTLSEKQKIASRHRGHRLFGPDITYGTVAGWLRAGADIKSTTLSDEFDFEAYSRRYPRRLIPLFAVDQKDRLSFFTADRQLKPESGWKVTSVILPEGHGELQVEARETAPA